MTEYWIDGPPERFEVGMLVRMHYPVQSVVVVAGVHENGNVVVVYPAGNAAIVGPRAVAAHCPMMPVKEAEEMAREAWTEGAMSVNQAGFSVGSVDGLLAEWRERRAGDE